MPTGIIPERKDADMKYELNSIISIKIRDNLFSLAQARENHLYEFFDVKNETGHWSDINLNNEKPLFCIFVASSKMKGTFLKPSKNSIISHSTRPTLRTMLSAFPISGGEYSDEVNLVEPADNFEYIEEIVVRKNLLPRTDAVDLCKYELTGMIGSKKYIVDRLNRHFTEGINWDIQKDFIFKGDLKPIKGINF